MRRDEMGAHLRSGSKRRAQENVNFLMKARPPDLRAPVRAAAVCVLLFGRTLPLKRLVRGGLCAADCVRQRANCAHCAHCAH